MKYKAEYCGFVIVETDDVQEAVDKVQNFVNSMKNIDENIQSKFFGEES